MKEVILLGLLAAALVGLSFQVRGEPPPHPEDIPPPPPPAGEEYICDAPGGCPAVIAGPNGPMEVHFRNGDMASTDDGYVMKEADGWTRLPGAPCGIR